MKNIKKNFIKTTIREFLNEQVEILKIKSKTNKCINENTKIAFDDEIKFELKKYLQNTVWDKVGGIDERVDKLIELHSKFINNVKNNMSADEIAKRLFEYEKSSLNRY